MKRTMKQSRIVVAAVASLAGAAAAQQATIDFDGFGTMFPGDILRLTPSSEEGFNLAPDGAGAEVRQLFQSNGTFSGNIIESQ